ncbi:MAG: hypothetical protein AAB316_20675, partial [Bacteroidota bacterium]
MAKITLPSDCSLGIALPLTQEVFLEDLLPSARRDLACLLQAQNPTLSPSQLWEKCYRQEAALLDTMVNEAAQAGVRVNPRFRLADLAEIADRPVFTLFAHWRGAWFRANDFSDSFALLRQLQEPESAEVRMVANLLGAPFLKSPFDESIPAEERRLCLDLRDHFNEKVLPDQKLAEHFAGGNLPHQAQETAGEYWAATNRQALEKLFPDLIATGVANRLELADGMFSTEEVLAKMPAKLPAIIDMTACHSIFLQDEIKRR